MTPPIQQHRLRVNRHGIIRLLQHSSSERPQDDLGLHFALSDQTPGNEVLSRRVSLTVSLNCEPC